MNNNSVLRMLPTLLTLVLWITTIQSTRAQPYIYQFKNDTLVEGMMLNFANYDEINLSNGKIKTDYYLIPLKEDNTQTFLMVGYDLVHNSIYRNDTSDFGCDLGINPSQAVFSKLNHKIFIIGSNHEENVLSILNSDSLCEELDRINIDTIQILDKMFLSSDESKLYIPYKDSNFAKINIAILSTSDDSIMESRELQNCGYKGTNEYDFCYGRTGKGLIISRILKNDKYIGSYYNIYDFDNNKTSAFIFDTTDGDSYFTNGGHLVLAQINTDANYYTHTGLFMIYDMPSQRLVKILNLPTNRNIYTFDNFPENIYYYNNKSEHAITLNIDSLVNISSGPTDSPKVIMYNLGSTVFTADFIKGKIEYELGSGFTQIKLASPTKDKLLYNEFDESNNLLGVFSFDKGYIKGTFTNNKSKKVSHFSRIDSDPQRK